MVVYPLSAIGNSQKLIRIFPRHGELFDAKWDREKAAWVDISSEEKIRIDDINGVFINLADFQVLRTKVSSFGEEL